MPSFQIKEWYIQKKIYDESKKYSVFDVGFSTFYLNGVTVQEYLQVLDRLADMNKEVHGDWMLDLTKKI